MEYARGIPKKEVSHELPTIKKSKTWEFGVHEHDAETRGKHFDLRLGDPHTGHAHSWALEPSLPSPGKSTWVIQQPTHTVKYMDFVGHIPEGYGKGDVKLKERGKAEIINARPGHITFKVGDSKYTLHRIRDKVWKFYNRIEMQKKAGFCAGFEKQAIDFAKRKYHEMDIARLDPTKENEIWTAKIDGAHTIAEMRKGEAPRLFSHRISKRTGQQIEYTGKVPHVTKKSPFDAVVRLETYATKNGIATDPEIMTSILNSGLRKSLELQKRLGLKTQTALIDVDRFEGRDVRNVPAQEKTEIFHKILKRYPLFHTPDTALTVKEKQKLLDRIVSGTHPQTKEGIVVRSDSKFIKAKTSKEHDVYVREIFHEEDTKEGRKPMAGGFTYSWNPTGPIVGRIGTGFSHETKVDMMKHPHKYVGKVARVKALAVSKTNVLLKPSFQRMHVEKNLV